MQRLSIEHLQRFGRLRVLEELPKQGKHRHFKCVCDCGNTCSVTLGNLRSGHVTSCTCLRAEVTIARNIKHSCSGTPEHGVWMGIRKRCLDPHCEDYGNYGGRGIEICERWDDFRLFLADVGYRPSPAHSIERLNVNGNYEPGNVVWATRKTQNRNTRANRLLTMNGETHCISEWDETLTAKHGVKRGRFKNAYYRYGEERALELLSAPPTWRNRWL